MPPNPPTTPDSTEGVRAPQMQVIPWEEAVPHNHANPEWFSRGCLRCQDEARLRYMELVGRQMRVGGHLARLATGERGFRRMRWLSSIFDWKRRYVYWLSGEDVEALVEASTLLGRNRSVAPGSLLQSEPKKTP